MTTPVMNPRRHAQEDWHDVGACEGYRQYPLGSAERSEYLAEAHRLVFTFEHQGDSHDES